jgi:hypothetical protein
MGRCMKQKLILLLALFICGNLFASVSLEEVKKIKNDKEVLISSFSKQEKERILAAYNDPEKNKKLTSIFYSTVYEFLNDDAKQCEADFYSRLEKNLATDGFKIWKEDIIDHLKFLRATNAIDDILYDIIVAISEDTQAMRAVDLKAPHYKPLFPHKNRLEKNVLEDLYWRFKTWPDEKTSCSSQEYIRLRDSIITKKADSKRERERYLKTLNSEALTRGLITLETFNKLEYFRGSKILEKRNIWLNDYFKIVFNAKNRMIPITKGYEVKDLDLENKYSSEKIQRFSSLTRRKVLYQKFNETQIIILAQIMQKASKRMGVDPDTTSSTPVIVQEYSTLNADGTREISVEKIELDTQSQYNLARRLMRKDMVDTQMMSLFNATKITYNDVVMASLEVGYITLEDIEFVVKYDDLWNPETTKFERMSRFVFSILGYSTFFLPPPWNATASLALGIIENVVDGNNRNGANNDNPGTFIE